MPLLKDYIREKVLGLTGGIVSGGSPDEISKMTFIASRDAIKQVKLREYDTWYAGNSDDLLNLYNKENAIDFRMEPWYWKNKRSYFWTVSSTEDDVKRTHSGQPANIIQTLCGLVGVPKINASGATGKGSVFGKTDVQSEEPDANQKTLEEILDSCNFWKTYKRKQLPMTLVEGWGCWKTSWDLSVSDHPYASFYRAQDVDFIWKGGVLVGIVFKDWYTTGENDRRYLVTELRYLKPRRDEETNRMTRDLIIETEAWKVSGSGDDENTTVLKAELSEVPGLDGVEGKYIINDFNSLLAQPCIFYEDPTNPDMPGKSIFHNKIDLFDDLDACLSQEANAINKSTVEELFNTDFLERDPETNLPIMPHRYDRKYTTFTGGRSADGSMNTNEPVQVTQPQVNFQQYSAAAVDILSQILSGIMSPATIGIGVAVQSTAQSQREKEKITMSTRNDLIDSETEILKGQMQDFLIAEEYLRTGVMTNKKYDVSVEFSEFADQTFEDKAAVLSGMLDNGDISPEMYMSKLYGDSLSDEDYAAELDYLKQMHSPQAGGMGMDAMNPMGGGEDPMAAMMGMAGAPMDESDTGEMA